MAEPPDSADSQMSDLEALMWTLEPDPYLSSSFANISFFDRTPDHDRLRRRLWRASRVVPRLRRRVVPSQEQRQDCRRDEGQEGNDGKQVFH